jgi:hypothetical protein
MSEYDARFATDAMTERAVREEQERLDRERGQHILDLWAARRTSADSSLADLLQRAHQSKGEADKR